LPARGVFESRSNLPFRARGDARRSSSQERTATNREARGQGILLDENSSLQEAGLVLSRFVSSVHLLMAAAVTELVDPPPSSARVAMSAPHPLRIRPAINCLEAKPRMAATSAAMTRGIGRILRGPGRKHGSSLRPRMSSLRSAENSLPARKEFRAPNRRESVAMHWNCFANCCGEASKRPQPGNVPCGIPCHREFEDFSNQHRVNVLAATNDPIRGACLAAAW
jgi:hypothetical protein